MQFKELLLHDFRIFGGRHTIPLEPKSPAKPIVLIGGLNGAGKTTLLDALQLVLYGKRAQCASRGDLSYKDYLRDSIHRNSTPDSGASIELAFTHTSEGKSHEYRVYRGWRGTGSGVIERVEVYVDGALDPVFSEHWDERVEDFAPHRIAHLFLFDGEKIEALADEKSSSEIVRTALHALLGLDLVDRLMGDLRILNRKTRKTAKGERERQKLESLERAYKEIESRIATQTSEQATEQAVLDKAKKTMQAADELYAREGGELADQRKDLETQKKVVENQVTQSRARLSERLAVDVLPFGQVSDQLTRMSAQATLELDSTRAALLGSVLEERDEELLGFLKSAYAEFSVAAVAKHLEDDRSRRHEALVSEPVLGLDKDGAQELDRLMKATLPAALSETRLIIEELDKLGEDALRLDRLLEGIPEAESLEQLRNARAEARAALKVLESRRATTDDDLSRLKSEKSSTEAAFQLELMQELEFQEGKEKVQRFLDKMDEAGATLETFRQLILERNLHRAENAIFESFQALLHKPDLIRSLRIDSETFVIQLYGSDGNTFTNTRLSAGERQLLAVATLWGLARVAGLPLPVVIDTPLGRLDSKHRANIVNAYFPKASHQVLLLSTDQEIEGQHLRELQPFVGRSYLLEYKAKEDRTVVSEGYFWN